MNYIADADDKKVKGLFMLIEDDISKEEEFKLDDEQIKMLELDRNQHIKGKSKSYSREDAKQIVLGKRRL